MLAMRRAEVRDVELSPLSKVGKKHNLYIYTILSYPGKVHTSVFVGWAVVEDFPFNLGTSVRHRS